MKTRILQENQQNDFRQYLIQAEKSAVTVEKYLRDVRSFFVFAEEITRRETPQYQKTEGESQPSITITKELVLQYKNYLLTKKYAVVSINSMLASINNFFKFMGWNEYRIKNLKQQKKIYCAEEKELTKKEYLALIKAAENQPQLSLIMQTICGTGIRVSELKYFTVEDVSRGEVLVQCKNKSRIVLVPGKLRKLLLQYSKKNKITRGRIFVTKKGGPIDRSNIWKKMKKICKDAGVAASKVFPHNLRKLFARTFYGIEKDIAKLADILGHGSIETTRIYIMTTGLEHRRKIEKMDLVIGLKAGMRWKNQKTT